MKKNGLSCQSAEASMRLACRPRPVLLTRAYRQLLQLLPACAVILVLSTGVLFLTAGPGRTKDNLLSADAGQIQITGSSEREGILLSLQAVEVDYQDFPLVLSRSNIADTAPATPLPVQEPVTDFPDPELAALLETGNDVFPDPGLDFQAGVNPDTTVAPEPTPDPIVYDAAGIPQEGVPVENFTPDNTLHYVRVNQANIRELPGTSAPIVAKAAIGDKLIRLGYGLDWSKVQTAGGKTGYVLSSLITTAVVSKPTPTPTPKPTPRPTAKPTPASVSNPGSKLTDAQKKAIVDLAKSCRGIKYVYGAESPKTGFDCSGFTTYVYKTLFGVTLPRSARDQARAGIAVSRANIQIGDIICFDWDSPRGICDHVGLYIGGGTYIHAAYHKGKVLQSTLKSTDPVVSIRRIIH